MRRSIWFAALGVIALTAHGEFADYRYVAPPVAKAETAPAPMAIVRWHGPISLAFGSGFGAA